MNLALYLRDDRSGDDLGGQRSVSQRKCDIRATTSRAWLASRAPPIARAIGRARRAGRRARGQRTTGRAGITHRSWLFVGRVLAGSSLAAVLPPALVAVAALEAVPDLPLGLVALGTGATSSESDALSAAVLEDLADASSVLDDLAAARLSRLPAVSGTAVAPAGSPAVLSVASMPVSSERSETASAGAARRFCCCGPASMS